MTLSLAEQPLLVSLLVGVFAAGLVYAWLQTGKRAAGWAGLVLFCLIPLLWLISVRWVTDRERIEQVIYEAAAAVEANDHERALQAIGDRELRARAAAELSRFVFSKATVTRIRRIDLIEGSLPPTAEVELVAKVTVGQRGGQFQDITVPRVLVLKFTQTEPDQWGVVDYRHQPIIGPGDPYSNLSPRGP